MASENMKPTPRISNHADSSKPSDVRTAREVVEQCISPRDIENAKQAIASGLAGIDVPKLRVGEWLFKRSEVNELVTTLKLGRVLNTSTNEKAYDDLLRSVLQEIVQRLNDSGRIAALKAIKVFDKTNRNVPARRTREDTVNHVTYETGVEDIEVGLDNGLGHTHTILLIEVKKHYENYPEVPGSSAASNTPCHVDIVYQCIMYAMRTQRSILRDVKSDKFVLVSLVMFKDVAIMVKLTSAEWWSYSYELKVRKYKLASAHDVVNILQYYVLRVLVVNADTNQWLGGEFQQDLSQLSVSAHVIAYPCYPTEAQVQLLPNVRLNHIRKCSLRNCVKALIQCSTLYWPDLEQEAQSRKKEAELQLERQLRELYEQLYNEANAATQATLQSQIKALKLRIAKLNSAQSSELAEPSSDDIKWDRNAWCSKLVNDSGNTEVVVKVVSALNYACPSRKAFTDGYKAFLYAVKNKVRKPSDKYTALLDLHVCVASRKANEMSSVVVTRYMGDCICARNDFLEDWKRQPSVAKAAFTAQVCNVCIGMLEDGLLYYHGDLRPPNICICVDSQNGFILTVIDWDNVHECGNFMEPKEADNFYPSPCFSSKKTSLLASAAYTAYQLLLTVYIIHRAANSGGDTIKTANEVELYMRICDPIYPKNGASGDTASGDATVGTSCSGGARSAGAAHKRSKYGAEILASAARERSNFQAWTAKMGGRFAQITKWLINQDGCSFDLLREYLFDVVNIDVTSGAESLESVVTSMSGESRGTLNTTAPVPACKKYPAPMHQKFKRPAPVPVNPISLRRSERLSKKSKT